MSAVGSRFRIPLENATLARVGWLIALRWLFILAIFTLPLLVARFLIPSLQTLPFLIIGLLQTGLNLLYRFVYHRLIREKGRQQYGMVRLLIQFQVVLDWFALLVLIHYTGGVESPLVHFFIFHLALSAIFLERLFTLIALFAIIVMTTSLFLLEATGWITPVSLPGLTWIQRQQSLPFVLNFSFWYFGTLTFLATLIGSVMRTLRRRETAALNTRSRLEEANERIRRNSEDRVRLMHTMGHELRSPIAATSSMLSALQMSRGTDLPEDVNRIHKRILFRLSSLVELIAELLELAESQRGVESKPSLVNLCALVAASLASLKGMADQREITLVQICRSEGEISLTADALHLERIFENLISNAIKYSKLGGTVTVRSVLHENDVAVSFSDEGIGIAPDQLDRLFGEFYRTPQSRRHTDQGTGLGLSITRDLAKSMGGRIEVQSALNQGSTFTLFLPLYSTEV
jgi:signal transduction histidine kinase